MLPFLRPSVLYVAGAKSPFAQRTLLQARLSMTGTGGGESCGREKSKVKEAVLLQGISCPLKLSVLVRRLLENGCPE